MAAILTHLAAEGEFPDAALARPSSLAEAEAELRRGVAGSAWSPCWLWCGDAGGGGGGGGCCGPAKTTLLSNVDHFMVPAPHPPRRSRPDPADSPEFRRDPPPRLPLFPLAKIISPACVRVRGCSLRLLSRRLRLLFLLLSLLLVCPLSASS